MTSLAHDLVMLGIPFDSERLFRQDDDLYELWLAQVADRVLDTKLRQQRESTPKK